MVAGPPTGRVGRALASTANASISIIKAIGGQIMTLRGVPVAVVSDRRRTAAPRVASHRLLTAGYWVHRWVAPSGTPGSGSIVQQVETAVATSAPTTSSVGCTPVPWGLRGAAAVLAPAASAVRSVAPHRSHPVRSGPRATLTLRGPSWTRCSSSSASVRRSPAAESGWSPQRTRQAPVAAGHPNAPGARGPDATSRPVFQHPRSAPDRRRTPCPRDPLRDWLASRSTGGSA